MNTTGVRNPEMDDPTPVLPQIVILALRLPLPPHADNEGAARHLRKRIGSANPDLEWVAVRPDRLVDQDVVAEYALRPSPTRSAIFDSGRTSRINVAAFMGLLTGPGVWAQWKGSTPVVDNAPVKPTAAG